MKRTSVKRMRREREECERKIASRKWRVLVSIRKCAHRLKSAATDEPSAKVSSLGMTVQPRRTPVKPAYLCHAGKASTTPQ